MGNADILLQVICNLQYHSKCSIYDTTVISSHMTYPDWLKQ